MVGKLKACQGKGKEHREGKEKEEEL